uniref:Putative secreted protein n=1 Tax=Ixodes ricinus TaxID=34613 RepID=A0A6B0V4E4_IXORI
MRRHLAAVSLNALIRLAAAKNVLKELTTLRRRCSFFSYHFCLYRFNRLVNCESYGVPATNQKVGARHMRTYTTRVRSRGTSTRGSFCGSSWLEGATIRSSTSRFTHTAQHLLSAIDKVLYRYCVGDLILHVTPAFCCSHVQCCISSESEMTTYHACSADLTLSQRLDACVNPTSRRNRMHSRTKNTAADVTRTFSRRLHQLPAAQLVQKHVLSTTDWWRSNGCVW